jgi:hypothetical protein
LEIIAMIIIQGKPAYKKIALETRKGNSIDNCQGSDFSASQTIPDYSNKYKAATMRNAPNCCYNCHGMTFASSRTKVFDESIEMILADDGYTEVEPDDALPGDVILYYNEKGEICHSGIITTKPSEGLLGYPWVVSKWGILNEVYHLAYDVPQQYQPVSKLRYWRITE